MIKADSQNSILTMYIDERCFQLDSVDGLMFCDEK